MDSNRIREFALNPVCSADTAIVYLARDIPAFVMYCFYGESRSSLLIELVYRLYDSLASQTYFCARTYYCAR